MWILLCFSCGVSSAEHSEEAILNRSVSACGVSNFEAGLEWEEIRCDGDGEFDKRFHGRFGVLHGGQCTGFKSQVW